MALDQRAHTKFFIPFNVPALKNGTVNGKFKSKQVVKYMQKLGIKSFSSKKKTFDNYVRRLNVFYETISRVKRPDQQSFFGFHFIRESKRNFDFSNAVQILEDLFTAHGFIDDDNINVMIPVPLFVNGRAYTVDKKNPGVIVSIFPVEGNKDLFNISGKDLNESCFSFYNSDICRWKHA